MWPSSTCGCPTGAESRSAGRCVRPIPDIVCVMLTSYADDEALIASIMAGAAGLRPQADRQYRPARHHPAGRGRGVAARPGADRPGHRPPARGTGGRPQAGQPHATRAPDPRPDRRGKHQPSDRRGDVPGREDGEELRLEPVGQARDGTADPGRHLCGPAQRARRLRTRARTPPAPDGPIGRAYPARDSAELSPF